MLVAFFNKKASYTECPLKAIFSFFSHFGKNKNVNCRKVQYRKYVCYALKTSYNTYHLRLWKYILYNFILFIFSSTTLLLPTHLPPPLCTHAQSRNPMDCSPPGSPFMDFSRQEYWSGLPFPSPFYTTLKTVLKHFAFNKTDFTNAYSMERQMRKNRLKCRNLDCFLLSALWNTRTKKKNHLVFYRLNLYEMLLINQVFFI